jgi:hypothetical protein
MKAVPHAVSRFVAARRRAVLPAAVPRSLKRMGGRTAAIPAHVRVDGVALSNERRADVRHKLGMKLGKFAWSIERVTLRAKDANGPRGGMDKECTVKVVLSGRPSVVVRRRNAALHVAIEEALDAVGEAVHRSLGRRRRKPVHGRSRRQIGLAEDGAPLG